MSVVTGTPERSTMHAVDGCYAFSPSPGTAYSSYLSAIDRMDEFDCQVPTKGPVTPPRVSVESSPHTRDRHSLHHRDELPIYGASGALSFDAYTLSSAGAPRSADQEAISASMTSDRESWMNGIPISPIRATKTSVRCARQGSERPQTAYFGSNASRRETYSSSSPPAPSAPGAAGSKAALPGGATCSSSLHDINADVAALRVNLHALLHQVPPGTALDRRSDRRQHASPESSNKSLLNAPNTATATAFAPSVPSSHVSNRSSRGYSQPPHSSYDRTTCPPPPSPHHHRISSGGSGVVDPAMHLAAVCPNFPSSCAMPHNAASTNDNITRQTPPVLQRRHASASNASSDPVDSSSGEPRGGTGAPPSLANRRFNPPCLPSMANDPLMRVIATSQPQGLNLSSPDCDASRSEHSRSRVRQEVHQARAQQDFETQAEQLARRLDEKLELVFALMRRIMILDARGTVSLEAQESVGTPGCTSSSLGDHAEEREQYAENVSEFRDALVQQLEVGEDETVSCTLSYVELINRHALQWMNERQLSAALQLLGRAGGLLRKDAGRVFRYLPDPVELKAAIFSSTEKASASYLGAGGPSLPTSNLEKPTSGVHSRERSGSSGGRASNNSSEQFRSINVPFFSPSQEPARLRAVAVVEHNLGIYHFKIGEYALAASCFYRAAQLEEELHTPGIGITYFSMAQAHHELRDLPKALQYVTLAEEQAERDVFAAKDAATQMRRHLAQRRNLKVDGLSEDTLSSMGMEAAAFFSNSSSSLAVSPQRNRALARSEDGRHNMEMRMRGLPGSIHTSATSELQSESACERELLRMWMQWREGICFMSCVKQVHAEWLDELGQYKASYLQYQQAHGWLVSVPRLALNEQRRAQKLKEHMAKAKRKWRREEVELELYPRPLNGGRAASKMRTASASRTLAAPNCRSSDKPKSTHRPQKRGAGQSSASSAGMRAWCGLSTPLQSTIVTSMLPRAVEMAGSRRGRYPIFPSHPPLHPVTAATPTSATVPSPASFARARRNRCNSANADLYSAHMPRPSAARPSPPRRRNSGEPVMDLGTAAVAGYTSHLPSAYDPAMLPSSTQYRRPEWNPATRVPVPPPDRHRSSRPYNSSSSMRSSGIESDAHRSSASASIGTPVHAQPNMAEAVHRAAQSSRRAMLPLQKVMLCQTPQPSPQWQQQEEEGHPTLASVGATGRATSALSAHLKSVIRSLPFDVDEETPKRPPICSLMPQLLQGVSPLPTENGGGDVDDHGVAGGTKVSAVEAGEGGDKEQVAKQKSCFANTDVEVNGDEERADGDDNVATIFSSENLTASLETQQHSLRPRGDLTWCVTVLATFLRAWESKEHIQRLAAVPKTVHHSMGCHLQLSDSAEALAAVPQPNVLVRQVEVSDPLQVRSGDTKSAFYVSPQGSLSILQATGPKSGAVAGQHAELPRTDFASEAQTPSLLQAKGSESGPDLSCNSSNKAGRRDFHSGAASRAVGDHAPSAVAAALKVPATTDEWQHADQSSQHDISSSYSSQSRKEDASGTSHHRSSARMLGGEFARAGERMRGAEVEVEADAVETPLESGGAHDAEESGGGGRAARDSTATIQNRGGPVGDAGGKSKASAHEGRSDLAPHARRREKIQLSSSVRQPPADSSRSVEDNEKYPQQVELSEQHGEEESTPSGSMYSVDAVVAPPGRTAAGSADISVLLKGSSSASSSGGRSAVSLNALEAPERDDLTGPSPWMPSIRDQCGPAAPSSSSSDTVLNDHQEGASTVGLRATAAAALESSSRQLPTEVVEGSEEAEHDPDDAARVPVYATAETAVVCQAKLSHEHGDHPKPSLHVCSGGAGKEGMIATDVPRHGGVRAHLYADRLVGSKVHNSDFDVGAENKNEQDAADHRPRDFLLRFEEETSKFSEVTRSGDHTKGAEAMHHAGGDQRHAGETLAEDAQRAGVREALNSPTAIPSQHGEDGFHEAAVDVGARLHERAVGAVGCTPPTSAVLEERHGGAHISSLHCDGGGDEKHRTVDQREVPSSGKTKEDGHRQLRGPPSVEIAGSEAAFKKLAATDEKKGGVEPSDLRAPSLRALEGESEACGHLGSSLNHSDTAPPAAAHLQQQLNTHDPHPYDKSPADLAPLHGPPISSWLIDMAEGRDGSSERAVQRLSAEQATPLGCEDGGANAHTEQHGGDEKLRDTFHAVPRLGSESAGSGVGIYPKEERRRASMEAVEAALRAAARSADLAYMSDRGGASTEEVEAETAVEEAQREGVDGLQPLESLVMSQLDSKTSKDLLGASTPPKESEQRTQVSSDAATGISTAVKGDDDAQRIRLGSPPRLGGVESSDLAPEESGSLSKDGNRRYGAMSIVAVPPTAVLEGFEDPLRTALPAKKQFLQSEMCLLIAAAHSNDNVLHTPRDYTDSAEEEQRTMHSSNDGAEAEETPKRLERACIPPPTPAPNRVRIFAFAPLRAVSAAAAELIQLTTFPARVVGDKRSHLHDEMADAPADLASVAAAARTSTAGKHTIEEADGSRSPMHPSPNLTASSIDAPLSFIEYCCDILPEDGSSRRIESSYSTNTQLSQWRASFWRSLRELGGVKIDDGVLHSFRSSLKPNSSTSASTYALAMPSMASNSGAAVETGPRTVAKSDSEKPLDSDDKAGDLRSLLQQLFSKHGIDVASDADAPPFRARTRPSMTPSSSERAKGVALQPEDVPEATAGLNAADAAAPTVAVPPENSSTSHTDVVRAETTVAAKVDTAEKEAKADQLPCSIPSSLLPSMPPESAIKERCEGQSADGQSEPHRSSPKHTALRHSGNTNLLAEAKEEVNALASVEGITTPRKCSNTIGRVDSHSDRAAFAMPEDEIRRAEGKAPMRAAGKAALQPPSREMNQRLLTSSPVSLEEDGVMSSAAGLQSPTRPSPLGGGSVLDVDDFDAEEAERCYLREQILREESAAVIQQAWRRCMVVRHPQRTFAMW
ncbi:hypothetical protein ABL78_4722 [Leptomonas seymouri]|uniref:Uncharacterized protein n=1 Tax=Leptomonas seymouri TaxID=5684 RepID=A0A0N0P598_LEPSE|nr:hypothetical protein ABL78_4722 [Leptomonas seymouri]|eukprot:KPI86209.1 hypothetical protein ABL78_4722 [Leptomonas seymouri]